MRPTCPGRVKTCLLALFLALLPAASRAETATEYAAKAAFIYNVALFSSVPSVNGTMRLCVLGRDPFGAALERLDGKTVGAARMAVAYPHSGSEALKQCQILFISASEGDSVATLADAARDAGVLTISDIKGAARRGVMLELYVEDKRIAFECNGAVARAASIGLSSKLLRLARAVY